MYYKVTNEMNDKVTLIHIRVPTQHVISKEKSHHQRYRAPDQRDLLHLLTSNLIFAFVSHVWTDCGSQSQSMPRRRGLCGILSRFLLWYLNLTFFLLRRCTSGQYFLMLAASLAY